MKVAIWAVILSLNSMLGMTEEVTPTENTHGCLARFCNLSGGCSTEYFVKVADDEYDSDDGESQIWGFNPNDKHYTRDGKLRFVPALAKNFIRAGGAAIIKGCTCHCPSW